MNSYLLRLEQMALRAEKAHLAAVKDACHLIRSDGAWESAKQKVVEATNTARLLRGFADDFKTLMGEREAA